MKYISPVLALLLFTAASPRAQLDDPFQMQARLEGDVMRLEFFVPENHYLYEDSLKVSDALGNGMRPISLPPTASITDPETGKPKAVFDRPFTATFAWEPKEGGAGAARIEWWGCNDELCFVPQMHMIKLGAAAPLPAEAAETALSDWQQELQHFDVIDRHSGGMNAEAFLAFLDRETSGETLDEVGGFRLFLMDPVAFVREAGYVWAILFILIGGLALNLTPCVLPMIPVNLAIIGAGARAGSRQRGFALGATYGLGIALVYGLLGVLVVLTGSQFGTIQANPWFNLVIALIFLVLALAMFDLFHIDFSRFQSGFGGGPKKQGSYWVALTMGAVAALLAGACVAPVVIAVLLLATNLYEASGVAGLALPFVLGLGMALPWPFAGAGLSFLPKPGKWMEYVKYAFGVGILLFALYYGHLSYRAFLPAEVHSGIDGRTNEGFAELLRAARTEGRPLLLDFTASWCKNCAAMEKTTFRDEAVKAALKRYTFVKYVSEDPQDPETRAVWQHFEVPGLPTFVVLEAKTE